MINKPLLLRTLKTIEENPQHWDQSQWHCGTNHCFAGLVVLEVLGLPLNTHETDVEQKIKNLSIPEIKVMVGKYNPNIEKKKRIKFSYFKENLEIAKTALGLDYEASNILFHGDNSLEDLKYIVNQLVNTKEIVIEACDYRRVFL